MKKAIYLYFIFFYYVLFGQSVLKVEYDYISKSKFGISADAPEESKKAYQEFIKDPEKHVLYYYKGNIFYKNFDKKEIQIISGYTTFEGIKATKKTKLKSTKYRIYKNPDNDEILYYHKFGTEEFYRKYKPYWSYIDYKNETQKIDEFECKLVEVALANKEIIKVWYTEMIPISTGPLYFQGFPGLVLKVESPLFTIYTTKISNDASKDDLETIDKSLNIYTNDEFLKKEQELKNLQPTITRKNIRL